MVKTAKKEESSRKLGYFLDMFKVESFVFEFSSLEGDV